MDASVRSKLGWSGATIPLLALVSLLCGCQKPDPYAKLDDALARFEAALQGPISQAEFVEHVTEVRTEWGNAAGLLEAVGDFSDGLAKEAWEHLNYSCQTDDFNQADISRGATSAFDLREYLNRLRAKKGHPRRQE